MYIEKLVVTKSKKIDKVKIATMEIFRPQRFLDFKAPEFLFLLKQKIILRFANSLKVMSL